MRVVGIIAEYNPFHNGHAFLIGEARRRLGQETDIAVVSVMSGNFVQRGDFSVMGKIARAESALKRGGNDGEGADLIVELPLPYSCASAEYFAAGAVKLFEAMGIIDYLVFGSEHGQADGLYNIAQCIMDKDFQIRLSERLKEGGAYAPARQRLVGEELPALAELMSEPNNILGIEYIKALLSAGSKMRPYAIERRGTPHDGESVSGEFASASYIRKLLSSGDSKAFLYMPSRCAEVISREMEAGRAPAAYKNCERAMLAHYRKMDEAHFAGLPDATEGLSNRIMKAARSAVSIDEIIRKAGTKRYPNSRIRRMLMFSYLGISSEMLKTPPSYIRVLAANEAGLRLLRAMRNKCKVPVITKPAHVKKLGEDARLLFEASARATDLYALAYPDLSQAAAGGEWTENIRIVRDESES